MFGTGINCVPRLGPNKDVVLGILSDGEVATSRYKSANAMRQLEVRRGRLLRGDMGGSVATETMLLVLTREGVLGS